MIFIQRFIHQSFDDNNPGDALLYSGLGIIMLGLVFTVVGLGNRGFHTLELQLVGPIIIIFGLMLVLTRVFMCTVGECWRAERNTDERSRGKELTLRVNLNKEGKLQYQIVKKSRNEIKKKQVDSSHNLRTDI